MGSPAGRDGGRGLVQPIPAGHEGCEAGERDGLAGAAPCARSLPSQYPDVDPVVVGGGMPDCIRAKSP